MSTLFLAVTVTDRKKRNSIASRLIAFTYLMAEANLNLHEPSSKGRPDIPNKKFLHRFIFSHYMRIQATKTPIYINTRTLYCILVSAFQIYIGLRSGCPQLNTLHWLVTVYVAVFFACLYSNKKDTLSGLLFVIIVNILGTSYNRYVNVENLQQKVPE